MRQLTLPWFKASYYLNEVVGLAESDNERTARILRGIADALLVPVAKVTGLPPEAVQGFVEGSSTSAFSAGKAKKGRKASAYQREWGRTYRRLRDKHSKKNGELKKGFTASRLMQMAHRETKRKMNGKK